MAKDTEIEIKIPLDEDHCTSFPETWVRWVKPWRWEKFPIGEDCCRIHDIKCSFSAFAKCLMRKRAVLGGLILLGGTIGCAWIFMSKVFNSIVDKIKGLV